MWLVEIIAAVRGMFGLSIYTPRRNEQIVAAIVLGVMAVALILLMKWA